MAAVSLDERPLRRCAQSPEPKRPVVEAETPAAAPDLFRPDQAREVGKVLDRAGASEGAATGVRPGL